MATLHHKINNLTRANVDQGVLVETSHSDCSL